jgi:acetylcholinesterase
MQHAWPENQRPFSKVIMNSGGPAARAWPNWTYPLYEQQAGEFFNLTGCSTDFAAGEKEGWECLRELDVERVVNASVTLYRKYSPSITWPFQPVVDGDYVKQAPSKSWEQGRFERVPVLTGYNTDEGTGFVPRGMNTTQEFRAFWRTLFPLATEAQLDHIEEIYPDPIAFPDGGYKETPFGVQFSRVAAAYGDYAYISTVRQNALEIARFGGQVWKYHFDKIVASEFAGDTSRDRLETIGRGIDTDVAWITGSVRAS